MLPPEFPPDYWAALAAVKEFHADSKTFNGKHIFQAFGTLQYLCRKHQVESALDYGCGKGLQYQLRDIQVPGETLPSLAEGLNLRRVTCFDPGVPEFSKRPDKQSDAVFVVDVLEYVPESALPSVLEDIFRYARKLVFIQASCRKPPKKGVMVDDVWLRNEFWWLGHILKAARLFPEIAWCARLRPAHRRKPTKLYIRMDGNNWALAGYDQYSGQTEPGPPPPVPAEVPEEEDEESAAVEEEGGERRLVISGGALRRWRERVRETDTQDMLVSLEKSKSDKSQRRRRLPELLHDVEMPPYTVVRRPRLWYNAADQALFVTVQGFNGALTVVQVLGPKELAALDGEPAGQEGG